MGSYIDPFGELGKDDGDGGIIEEPGEFPEDEIQNPESGGWKKLLIAFIAAGICICGLAGFMIFRSLYGSGKFPDCTDMSRDEDEFKDVLFQLDRRHIPYKIVPEYTSTMKLNVIVGQSPEPGKYSNIKEAVIFKYNAGIDFLGWMKEDAEKALEAEGWTAEYEECYNSQCLIGSVCSQFITDYENQVMTLEINKAPWPLDENDTISTKISATLSNPAATVFAGGNTSITVKFFGNLPQKYEIIPVYDETGYFAMVDKKLEEGNTDAIGVTFTVVGKKTGVGYLRFYLKDASSGKNVSYIDWFVKVE